MNELKVSCIPPPTIGMVEGREDLLEHAWCGDGVAPKVDLTSRAVLISLIRRYGHQEREALIIS